MNMRLKKILSCCILISMLSTTLSIDSLANRSGGGNGGGSSDSSATGSGSVDVKTEMQGYRFTLVYTNTGEKVGNTVDVLRSRPQGVPDTYWFKGSAADDDWMKTDTKDYLVFLESEIKPWLEERAAGDSNIPWWFYKIYGDYGGETDTFKKWFFSDAQMENMKQLGLGRQVGQMF